MKITSMAGARVAVVGDVMLDRFIYGKVERISPEAPIPILAVEREVSMLGGAGNVARNLEALGARPDLLTVIGSDSVGDRVQSLAKDVSGAGQYILREPGRKTTVKERYIASGQQLLRVDRDPVEPIKDDRAKLLREAVYDSLAKVKALVISDYGKGTLNRRDAGAMISAAGQSGVPVIVDPKLMDWRAYENATVITPNAEELKRASGLAGNAGALQMMELHEIGAVLVTKGADGMTLVTRDRTLHFPAEAREVFDVSGAGDTVVAVVAAALAVGSSLESAARLANLAAGIVVGKLGTAVVSQSELLQAEEELMT